MSNTSATGGYLVPTSSEPPPGGLTLEDFIQTVLVGVSGIAGTLVRPKWQIEPPKYPDITVNWIAFAIVTNRPDANASVSMDANDVTLLQRQETLSVQLSFYGPDALEKSSIVRDGFQIQQNLEALRLANMGYNGITDAVRGPDLFNERWVDRYESTLTLVRQVQRAYPILAFASAHGSIHTDKEPELIIDWETPDP